MLPVFIIYSVLLVIAVACWVYVESVDPAKPVSVKYYTYHYPC